MTVGVLGLQGAVREHVRCVSGLGVRAKVVRRVEDLDGLSGLILPGGESTTMSLLAEDGILSRLKELARDGFPMFGTCAGMILLASEVDGRCEPHIGVMDIAVARNASGRQVDSFETVLVVEGIGGDVPAVFIRAPYVTQFGPNVVPMARHEGFVVAAREGNILVTSFHPELTGDLRVHRYFVEIGEHANRGRRPGK
jgi:5'-phosphate synthase pdxT subunit